MHKIILPDPKEIQPFNERARDLRVLNKPLWLLQREILDPYVTGERELRLGEAMPEIKEETFVYRDNIYFSAEFFETFIKEARARNKPCRVAFSKEDTAFREHALPLATTYVEFDDLYLLDMWYYPNGPVAEAEPVVIDMKPREIGYYHVPTYMANEQGDLTFQVPLLSCIAIDSWVHIHIADVVFGLFSRGAQFENELDCDPFFKLKTLGKALYEGKQVLECSELVQIGRNCVIDPSAVIHGPTTIGDNVTIGAGAVIENSIIGNNVNISQGCQVMLSVVGDGTFLPFRAALFMTTLMENAMVAQNTCLQMCVIGRNTFIGAGSTFTDFSLIPTPLRAVDGQGKLSPANREVLGGCVGHNCRIGSGMLVMPARTIESDVVLVASEERRVISRHISFAESDHHDLPASAVHRPLYQPEDPDTGSW
jgi:carbonic anhydrase/acetyltransferase-like protein (isoleucine patch superfamily)